MATEVERLVVTLDAKLAAYEANMARAQRVTNQQLSVIENRFEQFTKKAEKAGANVGVVLGTIGTYLGAQQLTEYANGWTRITRSLDANQQVFGITLKNASELTALANDARVDLDSYAKLYVRTSAAIRDYGYDASVAATVTSTLSKALKLGGATAGEQASVLLQFSQALQKGKLDGDEFRTVMENAGIVQELLAKRLGVTKGEIIKMAAAGKLQIKDLVGAMTDGAELVDRVYRGLPVTVDEAFQVLNNSIVEYVGNMDQAYSISSSYAGAVSFLARNIETAGDVTLVLGTALLTTFSPLVIARVWAFAAAATAATGPLGLAVTIAAAAGAAYVAFADDIQPIPGQLADLNEVLSATSNVVRADLEPALRTAGDLALSMSKRISEAFGDAKLQAGIEKDRDLLKELGDTLVWLHEKAYELAVPELLRKQINSGVLAVGGALVNEKSKIVAEAERLRTERRDAAADKLLQAQLDANEAGKGRKVTNGSSVDPNAKLSAYQKEVNEIVKKTNALQAQAKTIGLNTYETQKAAIARDLLTAAEETARRTGTAVTAAQLADIQQAADKYAKVAAQVEYLNAMQSSKESLEALRDQNALIGLQGTALEEATVRQQLLNAARKAGTEADAAAIEQRAKDIATQKQFAQVVNETREGLTGMANSMISAAREGKSAMDVLAAGLNSVADKLIDMATKNLVEGALGALFSGGAGGSSVGAGFITTLTKGFASGGYTGNGARNQPAGIVHKGEYVVDAATTAKNRGLLEALSGNGGAGLAKAGASPSATSGGAGNVTVAPIFNVENGTAEGVDKLETKIVPLIKSVVADAMSRNPRFGRS